MPRLPAELRPILGDIAFGAGTSLSRHIFRTADEQRSISLTRDFVAIEDKKYVRWEEFAPEVKLADSALRKAYRTPFYQRVGLRYRNTIDRAKIPGLADAHWKDLIRPPFTGLLQEADARDCVQEQKTELVIALDEVPGAFMRLVHGLRQVSSGADPRGVFFFDADLFKEGKLEHEEINELLDTFHVVAGHIFRWAITRPLYDALEPEDV